MQSNEEIWGENWENTCGRKNYTLFAKEVSLYGDHYWRIANIDFLTIQGLMGKLQAHEEIINDIQ